MHNFEKASQTRFQVSWLVETKFKLKTLDIINSQFFPKILKAINPKSKITVTKMQEWIWLEQNDWIFNF